ncbi:hypothetical protein [Thalassovita sp.]|nr:hypothetical protein [Thalassovita sp.]
MGRLIKWVVILIVLAVIGLTGYAYVGPFLGADFSPKQTEIREKVVLDAG